MSCITRRNRDYCCATNSMRRLAKRPLAVALLATGCVSPWPCVISESAGHDRWFAAASTVKLSWLSLVGAGD